MKTTKCLFNIVSVICFVYGIVYFFSLVFIPVGVYCFIAAKRFSYKAEHMFDLYTVNNDIIKNYTIFVCFACFPLGLLAIVPYLMLTSNRVKIEGFKIQVDPVVTVEEKEENKESKKEEFEEEKKETKPVQFEETPEVVETEEEKQEKFKKLQNFRDKGIITEEELEMAREQLFGEKK